MRGQKEIPARGPMGHGVRWGDCQISSQRTPWSSLKIPVGYRNKAVLGDCA